MSVLNTSFHQEHKLLSLYHAKCLACAIMTNELFSDVRIVLLKIFLLLSEKEVSMRVLGRVRFAGRGIGSGRFPCRLIARIG